MEEVNRIYQHVQVYMSIRKIYSTRLGEGMIRMRKTPTVKVRTI